MAATKRTCLLIAVLTFATTAKGQEAETATLPQGEEGNLKQSPTPDDGALFRVQQMPRRQIFGQNPHPQRGRVQGGPGGLGVSREALRERLDSIILLMSRHGDRMVAMETKLNQQTERIDNINYRITKLELQGEERKGQLSEVSAAVRHRLQTSDSEMERITDLLDDLKTSVGILSLDANEMKTTMKLLKSDTIEEEERGPRLQAVMAAVYSLRAFTEIVQQDVVTLGSNFTSLSNITRKLGLLADTAVTRKDLVGLTASLKNRVGYPMVGYPVAYTSGRAEAKRGKGEAADCWELLNKRGKTKTGIYRIQPPMSMEPFFVFCDMETDGGGWTVIQAREDGTVNFAREWTDYKHGFGNLGSEFWLGNEKIYRITNHQVNELYVKLGDFGQRYRTAKYSAFSIGSEQEGYALRLLGSYSGDAGDSLRYHVGQKWSTIDVDNDEWPDQNCARDHVGAWWYKACDTSNLNGRYLHGAVPPANEYQGIYWYDFHGPQYSLWRATMMVRRGNNVIHKEEATPPPTNSAKSGDEEKTSPDRETEERELHY